LPQQALADFYRLGEAIDIALEPFPLTGAVTTAQALWMGLPCLTLAGTLPAERAAAAILAAANLPAGIVDRKTTYIEHAIHWASDPATLDQLRQGLRPHLQASPLLDHAGFTRALEATLLELIAQHAPC
jgi:predicted O-linked N-acetylglucosamine transferase (SPINDLY family)